MSGKKNMQPNDSKFFSSNSRKGENHELKEELRSQKYDVKRDAVKKVIANMTVGKDVSTLFTEVVNCIQTDNLELKKLVYLYIINYAKTQPDYALLCVNTFTKDASDSNPLIRALAIRTMGCIRVDKITEYLCEPLSRCLRDEDPYVRKTAAICVAKLYDIAPELVEDRGFVEVLRDMIGDANPTVVSNAVAALSEIAENSGKDVFKITVGVLHKLLAALNESTEWGQVFILDALSTYLPSDVNDPDGIIDRIAPRLQHANSAVVMSAVKVMLRLMDEVHDEEKIKVMTKKLTPPLVSLLNSEPEMQYVALRSINLIVIKRPKVLENEVKVFFCKYNDPIYVKMEKLEIIIRLVSDKNVNQVLLELKEYATEVDLEFVRRAVRAIGRCAIKLEVCAERCINVLLELIQTKVNYVVQESIVVIKDIFRKYPNRYESVIATLCENLETLDEPDAKASMIWIIGEYADRIDNANELLDSFLETFADEPAAVQLQLLTATVKVFLKSPESVQNTVQNVLTMATEESENPDLRDRGYIYWRLLSSDPEAARAIVLSEKAGIDDDTTHMEMTLLNSLLSQIACLASIYHKPPEAFIMKTLQLGTALGEEEYDNETEIEETDIDYNSNSKNSSSSNGSNNQTKTSGGNDLLDLMTDESSYNSSFCSSSSSNGRGGTVSSVSSSSNNVSNKVTLVTADVGHGVSIAGVMVKKNGVPYLEMDMSNSTSTPVNTFSIQFNKNIFGIVPTNPTLILSSPISNNSTCSVSLPLSINAQMINPQEVTLSIQSAVKNNVSGAVFYFTVPIALDVVLVPGVMIDITTFGNHWKGIDEGQEVSLLLNDLPSADPDVIRGKLQASDITMIAKRDIPGQEGQSAVYYACKTQSLHMFFIELKLMAGRNVVKVAVRSASKAYSDFCLSLIGKLLTKR